MEKKNKRRSSYRIGVGGIILRAALVLFVLILLSIHLMGGLFAKYVSSASGHDSGRVIKFHELSVEETGDFVGDYQFTFIPGVDLKKSIKVAFGGSEAATIVFVKVDAPGWTTQNGRKFTDSQGQLSWSVADSWTYLPTNDGAYVYYITLTPNKNLPATEFIQGGVVQVSEEGEALEIYSKYPPTSFTVTAYAMQSNGVNSVAEAWSALNH